MKTQNTTLNFIKHSITELNDDILTHVNGGGTSGDDNNTTGSTTYVCSNCIPPISIKILETVII